MRNGVYLIARLISTLSGRRFHKMERGFWERMPENGGNVKVLTSLPQRGFSNL